MSTINSDIINTKNSENNSIKENNKINEIYNNNNVNNDEEEESPPYYKLFIYSDTGSCIYKLKTKDLKNISNKDINQNDSIEEQEDSEEGIDKDLGAIQGIIQAVFFTPLDINCTVHMISTDVGLLSYKEYSYEKNMILLALIFPNYYSDETLSHRISQLLLDFIYNYLLMNIGKKNLYRFNNSMEVDYLKKIINIYSYGIHYILNNHSSLNFLLKAEKKSQIDKDTIYSIKHYMEKFKKNIKKDILCITINNNLVWATSEWLNINITDRILFLLISKIFCSSDIIELPIYFTNTLLEDEGLGLNPYKLIIINLMKNTKLLIVSDNDLDIEKFDFSIFDDFFISRITQIKFISTFENDVLDTYLKAAIVHNKFLKSYKILGNPELEQVFQNFLINNIFSNFLFDEDNMSDQFYVKDNNYYIFYYYRINALCFLLLFDKDTSFDDINTVIATLKTLKDSFDNRDNYKDINDEKFFSIK